MGGGLARGNSFTLFHTLRCQYRCVLADGCGMICAFILPAVKGDDSGTGK